MGELIQGRSENIGKTTKRAVSTIIPKQPGSQYTNEERRAVIADFVVTGNITKTAELHNMPAQTVGDWTKSDWGVELVGEIREQKGPELDANMTRLIDSAFSEAQDRVENGNFQWVKTKKATKKNNGDMEVYEGSELRRIPMNGKDLIVGGAVVYDKRQLHRNRPTQIQAQAADAEIQSFIREYREIARSYKEKQLKVVSTQ